MKHKEIIKNLTLSNKAALMSGKNMWETVSYVDKEVPSIFLSDGPHGLRKQTGAADHLGLNESLPATCFPTAATLANSWDESLIEAVGYQIGAESSYKDVDVILGPGLNIKRNPKCGRNFEYFSEDPFLTGKMAAAHIRGIQSSGTYACPKHYAVNSQETIRMSSNSIIDERTFREIYMTGFEIAVKEGKPKSIMSAYNKINGVYAHENKKMLRDILHDDWGFEGIVVSDWGGSNDHVLSVKNGAHLAMPTVGPDGQKQIIDAVLSGKLSEAILDERVDELLDVILAKQEIPKIAKIDYDAHNELAQKAARESIVLLKNEDHILPLKNNESIALIGDFVKTPRYQGSGSSIVNPMKLVNTLDEINNYPLNVVAYAQGFQRNGQADQKLLNEALDVASRADKVLLYLGLSEQSESEGMDREHIKLAENQRKLVQELAKVNKNIVAVLSAGSVVEMTWDVDAKAVLHTYLSGQMGALGILDVLCGHVSPSGKLNETYPHSYRDIPFAKEFPSTEEDVLYKEGIFVGYRYFDTINKSVKYPFGYGLSYSEFKYKTMKADKKGVTVVIENVGEYDAAEIIQVYIAKKNSAIPRAGKELKAFTKVFLNKGESKEVFLPLNEMSFRVYDASLNQWVVEAGEYKIMVARNVNDVELSEVIELDGVVLNHIPGIQPYYSVELESVSDSVYSTLLERDIESVPYQKRVTIESNDPIKCIQYAKSGLARTVFKVMDMILNRSKKKGKPNLNILFIYNMPFRAIAKMTNGMVSADMVDAMLVVVNGRFIRGLRLLISTFFSNQKLVKDSKKAEV